MTDREIVDWLLGQCVPGEGECMLWRGGVSTSRGGSALPTAVHPNTKKNTPARRILLEAMGKKIVGKCATSSCRDQLCMAPQHAEAITRKELQLRSGPKLSANVMRSAKLAELVRQRQCTLTMEQVREIRSSGMRASEAAKVYGVPLQVTARILRGDTWKDYSNPFAALGAFGA